MYKRQVVARCAGPRSALAALASATASATEDLVVVVTAAPRRTAQELEARLRTQRDVLLATEAAPELVDSAFWGRLFAATEDAAVIRRGSSRAASASARPILEVSSSARRLG